MCTVAYELVQALNAITAAIHWIDVAMRYDASIKKLQSDNEALRRFISLVDRN